MPPSQCLRTRCTVHRSSSRGHHLGMDRGTWGKGGWPGLDSSSLVGRSDGVHAGITLMSPGVAIATVVVLVAVGGEVANLMTGVAMGSSF